MRNINAMRKTISIIPEHNLYLREYSEKTGMSESEFLRRLIEQYKQHHTFEPITQIKNEQNTNSPGI